MKTMDDDVVAGRSQWKPVTVMRLICQVDGVKKLSERWQRLGGGTTLECSKGLVAQNQ